MGNKKQKKAQLKGDALVNKVALILIEIINIALIFGYISDFFAGNASVGYFVTFEAAAITTFVVLPIVYKVAPAKLKYMAFVFFAIVYTIGILGASTDVAFVMAFPIVALFVLYYDHKLMIWMCSVFGIICTVDIAYIALILKQQHSGLPLNSSILLMEFLGTTIFLFAVERVTRISIQNNTEKINQIQSVAEKVNESIGKINVELNQLTESSDSVKMAMDDINEGVNNTAEAIQHQLLQTEDIQNKIEFVSSTADQISSNVAVTMGAVEEGNREVAKLVSSADVSVDISKKVSANLSILKSKIDDMGSITQMIESIAFQTNIMALNANVEAAHAGEVGRGFAVVAEEISSMATKTKEATDSISDLISNATDSLAELVASINDMTEVIESEKAQTVSTSEIFSAIQENSESVKENVEAFMDYIHGLTSANREIVSSVSTISAVTEEVTALTNTALEMEKGNASAVESIARQMEELA